MATVLPHTTRATGTVLTAAIYNTDHQNHITNANSINADLNTEVNTVRSIARGGTGQQTAITAIDALDTNGVNIASAATTDIGAATGRNIHITGTTTITSFGTKAAGARRFLTFDGILTLTYHATNMILPGGGDIVTEAGDTAVAVSQGGSAWKIVSYTRANAGPLSLATEGASGLVDRATNAEIWAGTAGAHAICAEDLISASAYQVKTYAASFALNWNDGINQEVVCTGNITIANPTNEQPGTVRSLLLKGDSATDRSITAFGSEFEGDIPAITDIDVDRWYELTIKCISATVFNVSARLVKEP